MIKLRSKIYQCGQCGKDNDLTSNTKRTMINGTICETTNCYSCNHEYELRDNRLHSLSGPIAKQSSNASSRPEGDSTLSTILQYIGIGIVAFILLGVTINYFGNNSGTSQVTTTKQEVASVQYITPATIIQPKKIANCNFESSRVKALTKIKNLNLFYVEDRYSPDESSSDCSIKFHFYVKKVDYDLDGNSYLEDKLYDLKLTYKKVGNNFEFIDGKLFENSTQYQSIN